MKAVCRQLGIGKWPFKCNKSALRKQGISRPRCEKPNPGGEELAESTADGENSVNNFKAAAGDRRCVEPCLGGLTGAAAVLVSDVTDPSDSALDSHVEKRGSSGPPLRRATARPSASSGLYPALGITHEEEQQARARGISQAGAWRKAHAADNITVPGFEASAGPARRRRRVMACQWEDLGVMGDEDEERRTGVASGARSMVSGARMGDAPRQVCEAAPAYPPPPPSSIASSAPVGHGSTRGRLLR